MTLSYGEETFSRRNMHLALKISKISLYNTDGDEFVRPAS